MEMLFIGLLIGLALGFFWGVWRATQGFIERIMNNPDSIQDLMQRVAAIKRDAEQELAQDSELEIHVVTMERHQGVTYLYDRDDQFIAQGATDTEALEQAERRFPGTKFAFRQTNSTTSAQ